MDMMKKFMKKLWEKKDSKKGFTLVELIVVLVILAILAAIMVPALLGWIDKAKEKQSVLEARSVYMAMQAKASEKYATTADNKKDAISAASFSTEDKTDIQNMAEVTELEITTVTPVNSDGTDKEKYTISSCEISFKGSAGKKVTMTLNKDGNGTWEVVPETKAP